MSAKKELTQEQKVDLAEVWLKLPYPALQKRFNICEKILRETAREMGLPAKVRGMPIEKRVQRRELTDEQQAQLHKRGRCKNKHVYERSNAQEAELRAFLATPYKPENELIPVFVPEPQVPCIGKRCVNYGTKLCKKRKICDAVF